MTEGGTATPNTPISKVKNQSNGKANSLPCNMEFSTYGTREKPDTMVEAPIPPEVEKIHTLLPLECHGFALHKGDFCDAIALCYGWSPLLTVSVVDLTILFKWSFSYHSP